MLVKETGEVSNGEVLGVLLDAVEVLHGGRLGCEGGLGVGFKVNGCVGLGIGRSIRLGRGELVVEFTLGLGAFSANLQGAIPVRREGNTATLDGEVICPAQGLWMRLRGWGWG